jgi:hypothetical protein
VIVVVEFVTVDTVVGLVVNIDATKVVEDAVRVGVVVVLVVRVVVVVICRVVVVLAGNNEVPMMVLESVLVVVIISDKLVVVSSNVAESDASTFALVVAIVDVDIEVSDAIVIVDSIVVSTISVSAASPIDTAVELELSSDR